MSVIKNIESLIKELPSKDRMLANEFLKNRKFQDLKDLVDSAIIRINKNLNSNNPKEEYFKINLDKLHMLKTDVDFYYDQLQM